MECQEKLVAVLDRYSTLAIAVSGGVDSMVLTYIAHRYSKASVTAVHAVSPAVPQLATRRVVSYAQSYAWSLRLVEAGELADPAYLANPVNRCYFCKRDLYSTIRAITDACIASGTNVDDLSDFRPGLNAADEIGVVHPFVEAGLAKADIYALARLHKLDDLAALPAQPCLASRIETGTAVDAESLRFIENVESQLAVLLNDSGPIRCRITSSAVFVECGLLPDGEQAQRVDDTVSRLCMAAGRPYAGIRLYRRGSAFVRS